MHHAVMCLLMHVKNMGDNCEQTVVGLFSNKVAFPPECIVRVVSYTNTVSVVIEPQSKDTILFRIYTVTISSI